MSLQPTKRSIGIFKAVNMTPFSGGEAEAVALAEACDVLSAQPNQLGPYLGAMRSVNPTVCVLAYDNSTFTTETNLAEDLYLHDASGNRVHSAAYQQNWCMDPGNPAWAQHLIAKVQGNIGDHDGVMLDMMGPAPTGPHYLSGVAVNPRTKQPYKPGEWVADTGTLGAAVKAALGGKVVVGNGLQGGQSMAGLPTTKILAGIDGGLAEGWMPLGDTQLTTWETALQALATAQQMSRYVFPMVKPWGLTDPAAIDHIHRYSLASYLLGANSWTFYSFAGSNDEAAVCAISPYEAAPIGTPMNVAQSFPDGHYARRFTTGLVVVNPTAAAVPLTLNAHPLLHPHRPQVTNLDGQVVTSVELAPYSGEILHHA